MIKAEIIPIFFPENEQMIIFSLLSFFLACFPFIPICCLDFPLFLQLVSFPELREVLRVACQKAG